MHSTEETGRSARAEAEAQEKLRHMGAEDEGGASRLRHSDRQPERKRSVLEDKEALAHDKSKDKLRHMGDKR